MSTLEVGDPAPDFTLVDDAGTEHRLADRRGHWTVAYFYPADDTPGCTTEACQFRDLEVAAADEDAEIWGISPDDGASHRRFREKFDLPFVLLSDEDHAVSEAYGAWATKSSYGREYLGIVRSSFLVDPEGLVAHAWQKVKADGHAAEVLGALRVARAARADARSS